MSKRTFTKLVWKEVSYPRPFDEEKICEILSHIAVVTPRGPVILEARSHGGYVKHYIGADTQYITKLENTIKAHGDIQFYSAKEHQRAPVGTARQLTVTHPGLTLKTETTSATIRAGLAALAAVRGEEESVVQVILGKSFKPQFTPKFIPDPDESWLRLIMFGVDEAPTETRKSIKEKNEQYCFEACIRIGASGENQVSRVSRINNIFDAFRTLESAGVRAKLIPEKAPNLNFAKVPWHFPLRLSVKELTSFTLLPFGEEELPGTIGLHPRLTLPPKWYREPTNRINDRTFANSINVLGSMKLSIDPESSLEHLIITGPTGSGKSTIGKTIVQLLKQSDGDIIYKGKSLSKLIKQERREIKKHIQIVFQDPYSSLNPLKTVGQCITEVMRNFEILNKKEELKHRTLELLSQVGLDEDFYDRYPHQLSGGQRQRVVLARTLCLSPKLIICDESVSALDVSVQAQVLNLLNDLKRRYNFTYIFISHDMRVVKYMSDRIVVLNKDGYQIIESIDKITGDIDSFLQ